MTRTKFEFIEMMFPEVKDIDPYTDRMFIHRVMQALIKNNYAKQWSEGLEVSTLNAILRIQGTYQNRRVDTRQRLTE